MSKPPRVPEQLPAADVPGCPWGTGYGRTRSTYVRRRPEDTVLHRVVREHLETFLAEARLRGGGEGVPAFVEREFREFLSCGVLARGFARFRCTDCFREILVAFSCKGRGWCPSCCGRRMAELAAHLVDGVLGGLPVRQWVLTLPYRLRYALAWDHRLCRAVLAVFIRAALGFERHRAAQRGIADGRGGAVTAIQRFGSALNCNVHFHTIAAQGVFSDDVEGRRRFVPLPAPTDAEVARLLATVRRRIVRLVARHGIDLDDPSAEVPATDERLFEYPTYAEIQGAAVVGRVATGPRAGGPVQRLGRNRYAAEITTTGPLHAHLEGFDLQAAVAVPAGDRRRLEHLVRYVLRPPIAQERLELAADGAVVLRLRRSWSDGTRAIRFEPTEFLEKLAAMVPKPRVNLLLYHGAFAPHAHARADAVRTSAGSLWSAGRAHEAAAPATPPAPADGGGAAAGAVDAAEAAAEPAAGVPGAPRPPPPRPGYVRPTYYTWASLLARTFAIDILACPACGGRLRFVATIGERALIEKILGHLGLPIDLPAAAPARQATWLPGFEPAGDWLPDGAD